NTTADIHAINPVIKVISISKIRRIIKQINNTIISQVPFLKYLALLNKLCFIFLHPLQENVYQSTFYYILPILVREISNPTFPSEPTPNCILPTPSFPKYFAVASFEELYMFSSIHITIVLQQFV